MRTGKDDGSVDTAAAEPALKDLGQVSIEDVDEALKSARSQASVGHKSLSSAFRSPTSKYTLRLREQAAKVSAELKELGLDEDELLRDEQPAIDSELERLQELSLGRPSEDNDALSGSLLEESFIQSEWR